MYEPEVLTTKDNYAKTQRVNYGQTGAVADLKKEEKCAWPKLLRTPRCPDSTVPGLRSRRYQEVFGDKTFAIAARRSSSRNGLLIM
jgi:hypothetical protein